MKLTKKQQAFVDEYIISLNAADAARKAGYSKRTANVIGAENLSKPYIKEAIDLRLHQIANEKIATADEVLSFLTKVMRGEEGDKIEVEDGEISTSVAKIGDRIKSAELLGKRYGLFVDKKEVKAEASVSGVVMMPEVLDE